MKSYLLDTHIWLWSLVEPARLPKSIRATLENPDCELFLSPISAWESVLLGEKGRVEMKPEPVTWVRDQLLISPIHEAPLNHEIALRSRSLKIALQDPADRFLVATALVFNLMIITADQAILASRAVPCLKGF